MNEQEDMIALVGELQEISSSLKNALSRFVQQHMEFRELLSTLERKGLITAVELDKITRREPGRQQPTPKRCRQRKASSGDRY